MTLSPPLSHAFHLDTLAAHYTMDESRLVHRLLGHIDLDVEARATIHQEACTLVTSIRHTDKTRTAIDDLLQEYGLSTDEGVMLMRLSESLIRTPDYATSRTLIRDKIGDADWFAHAGKSNSFLVNQATTGLHITASWIDATGGTKATSLFAKLGDHVMERAMAQAMHIMGNHFVLGRTIREACARANKVEAHGVAHSYDMLGETAYTHADAERYFAAYLDAIRFLAQYTPQSRDVLQRAGLSVKLSALHPRYEFAKRQECVPVLVARVAQIAYAAADAGLWLNIDAEEADLLEVSLEIFAKLLQDPRLADWHGLGMVVQAYQKRAIPALDYIHDLATSAKRKVAVRLVKGAYWDMEIKRAQELGLTDYPVFTRKENTDISYLACARHLLNFVDRIFPQFATHNAHSAIAVAHMAKGRDFELQRLHGMGAALHGDLATRYGVRSRIYAPVGTHKDLLPYLVRRLLENGANGSFVNQVMDDTVPAEKVTQDPITIVHNHTQIAHPKIPPPTYVAEKGRQCAAGIDLTQSNIASSLERIVASHTIYTATSLIEEQSPGTQMVDVFSPQDHASKVGTVEVLAVKDVDSAVATAAASHWYANTTPKQRAHILERAANLLEAERNIFLELCVREAGKTLPDAVAELREAIDFCRYYASQAQEDRVTSRAPLGVIACISPWNFPLAIFIGQIVAALSVGNSVVAKPAPQTQIIAAKAAALLRQAGVPADALQLVLGDGVLLGNALVRHPAIAGICFTGSTRTAKVIAGNLADTRRGAIPFIAETGGINTMIVDSTALLEQAVQDVIASAFQSAGQRCSACRIVCVQQDVADNFITMLKGAMSTLEMGDPAKLSTDIGPVIDATARDTIENYKANISQSCTILATCDMPDALKGGFFSAPTLIEVPHISDVQSEIFGPVLHLVRFDAATLDMLVDDINALGFGLTLGVHTRLDNRVDDITAKAHIGNIYVNRNQIGAVVGMHPFGGESLSGTGPKAGGPHYLLGLTKNLCRESVITDIPTTNLPFPSVVEAHMLKKDMKKEDALHAVLGNARQATTLWGKTKSHHARLQLVCAFLNTTTEVLYTFQHKLKYEELVHLPGPTGETNSLRLCSRGVMLCFGGDTTTALVQQIALALVAGSSVIAVPADTTQENLLHDCQRIIEEATAPAQLVQWVSLADGLVLLDMDINGLTADGAIRHFAAPYACRRCGPILPILSATDPIERYLQERTLTVNTTAAGGNASLLAMQ